MKINVAFRRRAMAGFNFEQEARSFVADLMSIKGLVKDGSAKAKFDAGTGEASGVNLNPILEKGVQGFISYASRLPAALIDSATSDDLIILVVDPDIVDFSWFCREIFLPIVDRFCPYRAEISTDIDQDIDDHDVIVKKNRETGRSVNGRDSVFRLKAVNYFDGIFCERAFGLSPTEIASRVEPYVVSAKSTERGVFLVLADKPVSALELAPVVEKVLAALKS